MTDVDRCGAGDWVDIETVLLEPAERAGGLPPETAEKPLVMWVKGFARSAATMGDELEVETMTGRVVTGRLSAVNPGYTHTLGQPAPESLDDIIGIQTAAGVGNTPLLELRNLTDLVRSYAEPGCGAHPSGQECGEEERPLLWTRPVGGRMADQDHACR